MAIKKGSQPSGRQHVPPAPSRGGSRAVKRGADRQTEPKLPEPRFRDARASDEAAGDQHVEIEQLVAEARSKLAEAARAWLERTRDLPQGDELTRQAREQHETFVRDLATLGTATADAAKQDAVGRAFREGFSSVLGAQTPDLDVVRRSARTAAAEQAWAQRLGEMLDSRAVESLLGISRQRVSVLARQHRIVALPKPDGGYRFPAWQFAGTTAGQRRTLAAAHRTLVDVGGLSEWSALSWLISAHPELDGASPMEHLRAGRDGEVVLTVAARDGARLAR